MPPTDTTPATPAPTPTDAATEVEVVATALTVPAPAFFAAGGAGQSSATDDWATPRAFYDLLDAEFGFGLDVCASTGNHKAPAWYGLDHPDPSRRNGLEHDWAAEAARLGGVPCWMNPPYGRSIGDWMRKAAAAAAAGATVVCLVPARTDTAWMWDTCFTPGHEVRFVRGRLKFGTATTAAPFPSAVVIMRPPTAAAVEAREAAA